jgi:hypothetical protein
MRPQGKLSLLLYAHLYHCTQTGTQGSTVLKDKEEPDMLTIPEPHTCCTCSLYFMLALSMTVKRLS